MKLIIIIIFAIQAAYSRDEMRDVTTRFTLTPLPCKDKVTFSTQSNAEMCIESKVCNLMEGLNQIKRALTYDRAVIIVNVCISVICLLIIVLIFIYSNTIYKNLRCTRELNTYIRYNVQAFNPIANGTTDSSQLERNMFGE